MYVQLFIWAEDLKRYLQGEEVMALPSRKAWGTTIDTVEIIVPAREIDLPSSDKQGYFVRQRGYFCDRHGVRHVQYQHRRHVRKNRSTHRIR